MDIGNIAKNALYFKIGLSVFLVIVVIILLKNIGLLKSKAQRQAKKEKQEEKAETKLIESTINTTEYFSPSYYLKAAKTRLLTEDKAREHAATLRTAMKGLGTNESKIMGVFRSLTDKAQVSQIAFYYKANYNRDLVTDLTSELSKGELYDLFSVTDKL